MRTRVKIISDYNADNLTRDVNQFLKTIDETAEIVSIVTHGTTSGPDSRMHATLTVTIVYKEIAV